MVKICRVCEKLFDTPLEVFNHCSKRCASYKTITEKFLAKIEQTDFCWNWIGSTHPSGYGTFYHRGQSIYAHRYAYCLAYGNIPGGKVIDHKCRNRGCVNPAHLEAVTDRENILRSQGMSALNSRKTHCVRGHEFSEWNTLIRRRGTKVGRVCRICRDLANKARYGIRP